MALLCGGSIAQLKGGAGAASASPMGAVWLYSIRHAMLLLRERPQSSLTIRSSIRTNRRLVPRLGAGPSNGAAGNDDGFSWPQGGFPSYLQNQQNKRFPCEEEIVQPKPDTGDSKARWKREIQIWETVREEARKDAAVEPLLSSFLYASILAHASFEQSLAFVLANRLSNATMLPTQLFEIFHQVLTSDDDVRCGTLADLEAHKERDPSCNSLCHALLYFKGYHAIQSHRIAHALWQRGQTVLALALQSRMSEVFAVDLHPAARIGKGILLDHGTGVVIGETAVIGDNCSLLQNVTLGGTGKDMGDRHPKVARNVLIGASATILGNIEIGEGAQIAAGSLVLKPVPPHTMVAGSPAKVVGKVMDNPAETMLHWRDKSQVVMTASLEEMEERYRAQTPVSTFDVDDGPSAGPNQPPMSGAPFKNGKGAAIAAAVAAAAAATEAAAASTSSAQGGVAANERMPSAPSTTAAALSGTSGAAGKVQGEPLSKPEQKSETAAVPKAVPPLPSPPPLPAKPSPPEQSQHWLDPNSFDDYFI